MTIGEKINEQRKLLGLSQEELGQKLLVSRQTISLWEKNQTVPSIDNLTRLKEIFGITVDEILCVDEKENPEPEKPTEEYQFTYTKDELKSLVRLLCGELYKKTVIFILCLVLGIFYFVLINTPDALNGIFLGILCFGVSVNIRYIINYKKSWKTNIERMSKCIYKHKIFSDHIMIEVYRDNEIFHIRKALFSDIEKIIPVENWFLLQVAGNLYIIRKSDLPDNSFFYSYLYHNPQKKPRKTPLGLWGTISALSFAASIFSFIVAFILVCILSSHYDVMLNEYMWIFFLFTPVTISSIVMSYILKAKDYKYKKNMITGWIMTALLCIYGSFVFFF